MTVSLNTPLHVRGQFHTKFVKTPISKAKCKNAELPDLSQIKSTRALSYDLSFPKRAVKLVVRHRFLILWAPEVDCPGDDFKQ